MRKSNILVVEDEREIGILIKKYLEIEGYNVILAEDGLIGLEKFDEDVFDLIITDIMMPRLDGVEFCKKIRKISNVPVIFLTAKDEEVDKLIGLMLGADDYITKPFSIREVVARVKSMLRRYLELSQAPQLASTIEINNLLIDFSSSTVLKNGDEIHLRAKEFEILSLLVKSPDKVFSKSQIFKDVWNTEYLGDDNTVMVHMRRLRKKIEEDANNPLYIKTIWGLGYKFCKREENNG